MRSLDRCGAAETKGGLCNLLSLFSQQPHAPKNAKHHSENTVKQEE